MIEFHEKKKPLIGFEPMTYALPWRYSTTELKGPQFLNQSNHYYADKISLRSIYRFLYL